jgi:pyrroloquinoline quinone (PQQ) biosynthesis protein C
MVQADSLVAEIRQALAPLEERIRQHPYLTALEEGRLPRERLRLFAGEQYTILGSDLRSIAHLVARFGDTPSREFFLNILQGERAAWDALLAFARALGLSEADLRAYEPQPGAHAYTNYVAWLALYGSEAEVAAAFLVNLAAWGANCGRMSRALKTRYGLREADVAFFDMFAAVPAGFEAGALAVIQTGLAHGAEPARIRRAARLLQAYELLFWDTVHQASEAAT